MQQFKDQLGRTVELKQTPKRIISLVPSQTELLYDLGLNDEVVGITKFCVHPDLWFRTKTRVGGTKQLHIEKIKTLEPDLIIANKEENTREQIEELHQAFPVWVSDVNNLGDAFHMIESIGKLTGKEQQAKKIVTEVQAMFFNLKSQISNFKFQIPNFKSCYLIWKDPYMTAGGDTFISDMMQHAGFENLFKKKKRYPEVSLQDLQHSNCGLLLLSSEPYPFKQKHVEELQAMLPHTKILLVDGEMFSWYGSRLLHTPHYFMELRKQIEAIS